MKKSFQIGAAFLFVTLGSAMLFCFNTADNVYEEEIIETVPGSNNNGQPEGQKALDANDGSSAYGTPNVQRGYKNRAAPSQTIRKPAAPGRTAPLAFYKTPRPNQKSAAYSGNSFDKQGPLALSKQAEKKGAIAYNAPSENRNRKNASFSNPFSKKGPIAYNENSKTPYNQQLPLIATTNDASSPKEQSLVECWCKYVCYVPCYYTTKRCIEEKVPCKKKCYRVVPEYYEVTRCKYVPQYYTEKLCRQKRECYETVSYKTCKKWICEKQCKYVPKYYWKYEPCGSKSGNGINAAGKPSSQQ